MGIINLIKRILTRKKNIEVEKLNMECNALFAKTFNVCRLELGSELIHIMKIKQNIVEKALAEDYYVPAKEMLTKKALSLIEVYLKLAQSYVDFKNSTRNDLSDPQIQEHLDETKKKLDDTFSLIKSLNIQFCANAVDIEFSNKFENVINEASALNNVLNKINDRENS